MALLIFYFHRAYILHLLNLKVLTKYMRTYMIEIGALSTSSENDPRRESSATDDTPTPDRGRPTGCRRRSEKIYRRRLPARSSRSSPPVVTASVVSLQCNVFDDLILLEALYSYL